MSIRPCLQLRQTIDGRLRRNFNSEAGLVNRRKWLGGHLRWPLGLVMLPLTGLGACAPSPQRPDVSGSAGDAIADLTSGRPSSAADVLDHMRRADIVLLGEVHDNPHHHQRRAGLLAALGRPVPVVVEHLPRGATLRLPSGVQGDALRQLLETAGFDSRGWSWPLHQPVFETIARAGHSLHGGNLARDATRRVAREGTAALPVDLKTILDAAPLSAAARLALEQDLQAGHCGQLAASHLPGMVSAQRGRDAAMAAALAERVADLRATGRPGPVVLLAGNGHVRRDYGVPQLLAIRQPGVRMLSIEFAEAPRRESAAPAGLFDVVWTTPMASRADPCAGFTLPRPAGR